LIEVTHAVEFHHGMGGGMVSREVRRGRLEPET
jgi:hypothetical protein